MSASSNSTTGISSGGIGHRIRGAIVTTLALGLLGIAVVVFLGWYFSCPCDRLPGARLSGEVVEQPVTDWSFANTVPLCQIQVDTGFLPHALNLNCMATPAGELYLSCAQCDGKYWSTAAIKHGTGRIRLGERVYPVTFTHVLDTAEVARAWAARDRKLRGADAETSPVQPDWWTFKLESRREG